MCDTTINAGPDSVISITEENGGRVNASGNIKGTLIAKASGLGQFVDVSNMTIDKSSICITASCQSSEEFREVNDLIKKRMAERDERIKKRRDEQSKEKHDEWIKENNKQNMSSIDVREENGGKIITSGSVDGNITIKADGVGNFVNASNVTIGSDASFIAQAHSPNCIINASGSTIKEGGSCKIIVGGSESEHMANKILKKFDLF